MDEPTSGLPAPPADGAAPDAEALEAEASRLALTGRPAEAAAAYAALCEAEPWRAEWPERRVEALVAAGDAGGALAVAEAAAAAYPGRGWALRMRGRALAAAGQGDDALAAWWEAWRLDPGTDSALGLRDALVAAGDVRGALDVLAAAARRAPDDARVAVCEGRTWARVGEKARAAAAFDRALRLTGGDPVVAAERDAIAAAPGDGITADYVRGVFDGYADRFDADLVQRLRYEGPAMIVWALRRWIEPAGDLDVIDLGCGTGLSGVPLRPYARRLAGVDLSPRMLDKARARGCYDLLVAGEAVAALSGAVAAWDIAVAADVLIYVRDPAPLFAAAGRALRPGGHLALVLEKAEAADVELPPETRRYRHSEASLRRAADSAGLEALTIETVVPRFERGRPVDGLLAVFRRPA
jgi:predicted TPR repeat methyltransferase